MKAERRHELRENSLVRGVRTFPEFWKAHGSKVALGVIMVLLAVVLIRTWLTSRADAKRGLAEQLTSARDELESMRRDHNFPLQSRQEQMGIPERPPVPDDIVVRRRKEVWAKVDSAVADVLKNSSDPAQQAEAKVLRADLNYHWALMSSIGNVPSAATQPSMAFGTKPEEYMTQAATNYTEVVNQVAGLPTRVVVAARLGLAAVAENRRDFAKARELYEQAQKESGDKSVEELVKARLRLLSEIRPDALAPSTMVPSTSVPTSSAATGPATSAATEPAPTTSPAATTSSATTPATRP
jgi:predicted negative regulator of RcsB-dependent stress response